MALDGFQGDAGLQAGRVRFAGLRHVDSFHFAARKSYSQAVEFSGPASGLAQNLVVIAAGRVVGVGDRLTVPGHPTGLPQIGTIRGTLRTGTLLFFRLYLAAFSLP
jgi:hypothetical protein